MDIRLKNSVWKSFRFEIIISTLLSLFYTVVTEVLCILVFGMLVSVFLEIHPDSSVPIDPAVVEEGIIDKKEPDLKDKKSAINNIANDSILQKEDAKRLKNQRRQVRIWVLGGIIALVIGICLFIFYFLLLTKRFSVYLKEISGGIEDIAGGDFNGRIRIEGEDEFAYIADRINNMAQDIQTLMESERNIEKEKNDLITNVAHDLRTPLTSILGYLELVKNKDLDAGTKNKYIAIAFEKSKRLEKLIEDLFDYTKVNFGEVKLRRTSLDIVKFIEQMIEEFYPSFQDTQLECEFTTNSAEAIISGDGDFMARGIGNILSNAVKYGRDGKVIKIHIEKEETEVHLFFTNYGEVIPAEDLEHIFDKFFRVENSRSLETGGTGLGLAIAKKVILMHSGSIQVSSDVDGTVFSITFPLESNSSKEEEEPIEAEM